MSTTQRAPLVGKDARLRTALFAILCAQVLTCARGPVVVFSVSNLPAGAARLEARAMLDGNDAKERPGFDLSVPGGQAGYLFGYRLPDGARGQLLVSVAARNAQGCLLTTGTKTVDLAEVQGTVDLKLDDVSPKRAVPGADCWTDAPVILQLEPVQGAPGQLRARGWGFDKGVRVQLANLAIDPATRLPVPCEAPTRSRPSCDLKGAAPLTSTPGVTRRSPTELLISDEAALLAQTSTGRLGVCVTVTNPDQRAYCAATEGENEILAVPFLQSTYTLGRTMHPDALVMEDLNGDGKKDIALSVQEQLDDGQTRGHVHLLFNQGGGVFPSVATGGGAAARPAQITIGPSARSVVSADFDKDGRPDLVVGDQSTNEIVLLLNQGPGQGGALPFLDKGWPRAAAGRKPDSLAAGDIDGDGAPDLALVNDPISASYEHTGVTVLRNINRGERFSAPESYFVGLGISFVAIGELDGQPGADLISNGVRLSAADPHRATGGLLLLHNKGMAGFEPAFQRDPRNLFTISEAMIPVSGTFGDLELVDLNDDGLLDILSSGTARGAMAEQGSVLTILYGQSGGGFSGEEYPAGRAPFSLGVADFNGDGLKDIALTNGFVAAPGRVTLLLQQKGGQAGSRFPTSNVPTYPMGIDSGAIAVGDLNGDGKPDLAVANFGTIDKDDPRRSQAGSLTVYLNAPR